MSLFGKTLFSGSRFIFWALAPVLILFAIVMPLSITEWNFVKVIVTISLDLTALLLTIGLFNPRRFWWALRGVTSIGFLFYLVYLIDSLVHWKSPFNLNSILAGESPWGAIGGFVTIGIPCLIYSVLGRFSRSESRQRTDAREQEPDSKED